MQTTLSASSTTPEAVRSDEVNTITCVAHYTCAIHIPEMFQSRTIKATESNLHLDRPHTGPDVVWALSTPDLGKADHGLATMTIGKNGQRRKNVAPPRWADKRLVRVSLRADGFIPYADYLARYSSIADPETVKVIVKTGGGWDAANRWRVHEGPLSLDDIVAVEYRTSVKAPWADLLDVGPDRFAHDMGMEKAA